MNTQPRYSNITRENGPARFDDLCERLAEMSTDDPRFSAFQSEANYLVTSGLGGDHNAITRCVECGDETEDTDLCQMHDPNVCEGCGEYLDECWCEAYRCFLCDEPIDYCPGHGAANSCDDSLCGRATEAASCHLNLTDEAHALDCPCVCHEDEPICDMCDSPMTDAEVIMSLPLGALVCAAHRGGEVL